MGVKYQVMACKYSGNLWFFIDRYIDRYASLDDPIFLMHSSSFFLEELLDVSANHLNSIKQMIGTYSLLSVYLSLTLTLDPLIYVLSFIRLEMISPSIHYQHIYRG